MNFLPLEITRTTFLHHCSFRGILHAYEVCVPIEVYPDILMPRAPRSGVIAGGSEDGRRRRRKGRVRPFALPGMRRRNHPRMNNIWDRTLAPWLNEIYMMYYIYYAYIMYIFPRGTRSILVKGRARFRKSRRVVKYALMLSSRRWSVVADRQVYATSSLKPLKLEAEEGRERRTLYEFVIVAWEEFINSWKISRLAILRLDHADRLIQALLSFSYM